MAKTVAGAPASFLLILFFNFSYSYIFHSFVNTANDMRVCAICLNENNRNAEH